TRPAPWICANSSPPAVAAPQRRASTSCRRICSLSSSIPSATSTAEQTPLNRKRPGAMGPRAFFWPTGTAFAVSIHPTLAAPLQFAGLAIPVAIELGARTVGQEVLRLGAGIHLPALGAPVTAKASPRIGRRRIARPDKVVPGHHHQGTTHRFAPLAHRAGGHLAVDHPAIGGDTLQGLALEGWRIPGHLGVGAGIEAIEGIAGKVR